MKKPRKLNVVGTTLRQLRMAKGLTQKQVAAKCSVLGWDVSPSTIAKVETQLRSVYDAELLIFAQVLHSPLAALFPDNLSASDLRRCLYKPQRRKA